MTRYAKSSKVADAPADTNPVGNLTEMAGRLGLSAPVAAAWPAAWPTGVAQLAQAIDACQRCDTTEVCTDWLARAPAAIETPPAFCPNAAELKRAKESKND